MSTDDKDATVTASEDRKMPPCTTCGKPAPYIDRARGNDCGEHEKRPSEAFPSGDAFPKDETVATNETNVTLEPFDDPYTGERLYRPRPNDARCVACGVLIPEPHCWECVVEKEKCTETALPGKWAQADIDWLDDTDSLEDVRGYLINSDGTETLLDAVRALREGE